jgi:DNA-binding NtrC family response regulator
MPTVLIVDDESQIRQILSAMLADNGFDVAQASSGEEAIEIAKEIHPHIALLDISLPGMDGLATLATLQKEHLNFACVMMTAHATIRSAVEAMRLGASDYITKPFDNDELLMIINRALEMRRLSQEVEELRTELSTRYGFNEIIGISPRLQAIFRTMAKVASVDATLLIEGSSGTGKELIARAIHRRSKSVTAPFVAVNCGAIPHNLFEAEFFGYERGAFTDAREARQGRFEQAQDGTLFLDEVGELPLDTQVKLLRALQEHEVTRLGGRLPRKVNVRVIAATNRDLKDAVDQGKFREDLYWRLNVVKIVVPTLKDRQEDVPLIIDHMLERFSREFNLPVASITPDARRLLEIYHWPGNVRELENTICSAMIMCDKGVITPQDLPPRIRGESEGESATGSSEGRRDQTQLTLADAVKTTTENLEKRMIISRLAEMNFNRTATAESLGVSRKTLFNKMRQYDLGEDENENSD